MCIYTHRDARRAADARSTDDDHLAGLGNANIDVGEGTAARRLGGTLAEQLGEREVGDGHDECPVVVTREEKSEGGCSGCTKMRMVGSESAAERVVERAGGLHGLGLEEKGRRAKGRFRR
jgi:hypothetical protein